MTPSRHSEGQGRIRVAVVGGGIGRAHLAAYRALPDLFDVVAVCDVDLPRAAGLAQAFDVPTARRLPAVTGSLDDLCRMDGLDVIDICTPSYLHAAHTMQVLAAGKHAVCEKPVAGSLAELDGLAEAEVRFGRRVMPIFNYRYGAGVQKLRHLIAEGVTGRAYLGTIEVAWRRRADYYAVPWRGRWQTELGGTMTTHAIHFLDQLTYVLGPVRSLYAVTTTRVNPIETEDCASVSFEMADGSLASLSVTMGSSVEISRQRYCFANLVAESNLAPYANNTSERGFQPWQFVADTPDLKPRMDAALASVAPGPEGFEGQFARFGKALVAGKGLAAGRQRGDGVTAGDGVTTGDVGRRSPGDRAAHGHLLLGADPRGRGPAHRTGACAVRRLAALEWPLGRHCEGAAAPKQSQACERDCFGANPAPRNDIFTVIILGARIEAQYAVTNRSGRRTRHHGQTLSR